MPGKAHIKRKNKTKGRSAVAQLVEGPLKVPESGATLLRWAWNTRSIGVREKNPSWAIWILICRKKRIRQTSSIMSFFISRLWPVLVILSLFSALPSVLIIITFSFFQFKCTIGRYNFASAGIPIEDLWHSMQPLYQLSRDQPFWKNMNNISLTNTVDVGGAA